MPMQQETANKAIIESIRLAIREELASVIANTAELKRDVANLHVRVSALEANYANFRDEFSSFRLETKRNFEELKARAFPRPIDREDLEFRVKYIEKHLGITSGK